VAEAVLRELAPKQSADYVSVLRSDASIKECAVSIDGQTLRFAAVDGLESIKILLERLISGECVYDFVEFMTCEGSCVNGYGQPAVRDDNTVSLRTEALRALADRRAQFS
jgi:iron only hydrogenase large subunit-like protein